MRARAELDGHRTTYKTKESGIRQGQKNVVKRNEKHKKSRQKWVFGVMSAQKQEIKGPSERQTGKQRGGGREKSWKQNGTR